MNWTKFFLIVLLIACCGSMLGCAGGSKEEFPEVDLDAGKIAAAIMAEYDADSNGEVSMKELQKCKGLLMLTAGQESMAPERWLDSDGNGSVSEQEFETKLAACFADKRLNYGCIVKYKGRPLPGATVTLVPESFMGEGVPSASGETDEEGQAEMMGDDGVVGAVPGIYRVEITHPEKKIASKYNTETIFSIALDTTNPYAQTGTPEFRVN